ncbi:MAG TPA: hypothetical protein VHW23_42985 [Kofleriaceae bacterium]|nr:hypothetical protein [Kofleriaceae bacterium]
MGVDLEVLIAHELTAEQVFELPERLSCALPVFAAMSALCAAMEPRWPRAVPEPWTWHQLGIQRRRPVTGPARVRELWADGEPVILEGAAGLTFIRTKLIRLAARCKLAGFADETCGIQAPIRGLCRALAHEVGSTRAIYLPDSGANNPFVNLFPEGASFEEAVARLTAHQLPARDLASLYPLRRDPDGWLRGTGEFAYFIDDFQCEAASDQAAQ